MHYEPYMDMVALPDLSVFQFISEGPRGRITKQIRFSLLVNPRIYDLELGDVNEYGGFDRTTVSNNGDRGRILATVIQAIEVYTESYPTRSIRIRSHSAERSRLFRIAIGANLRQLSASFTIRAANEGRFLPFKMDMDSTKFELKRKKTGHKAIRPTLAIQSRLFKKSVSVQLNNELPVGYSTVDDKKFYCGITEPRERRIKNPVLSGRVEDQAMLCGDEGAVRPVR